MLEMNGQILRKGSQATDFFFHHFNADDDMAEQLSCIGILELTLIAQFGHLANIMQECSRDQEIEVEIRVTPAYVCGEIGYGQ